MRSIITHFTMFTVNCFQKMQQIFTKKGENAKNHFKNECNRAVVQVISESLLWFSHAVQPCKDGLLSLRESVNVSSLCLDSQQRQTL